MEYRITEDREIVFNDVPKANVSAYLAAAMSVPEVHEVIFDRRYASNNHVDVAVKSDGNLHARAREILERVQLPSIT